MSEDSVINRWKFPFEVFAKEPQKLVYLYLLLLIMGYLSNLYSGDAGFLGVLIQSAIYLFSLIVFVYVAFLGHQYYLATTRDHNSIDYHKPNIIFVFIVSAIIFALLIEFIGFVMWLIGLEQISEIAVSSFLFIIWVSLILLFGTLFPAIVDGKGVDIASAWQRGHAVRLFLKIFWPFILFNIVFIGVHATILLMATSMISTETTSATQNAIPVQVMITASVLTTLLMAYATLFGAAVLTEHYLFTENKMKFPDSKAAT